MEMPLPKFNIYKGRVVPNCFRSQTNSWCPDFFEKKKIYLMPGLKSTFFDVILFLPDNLSWLERKTNVLGVINLDSIERWKVAKYVSHLGNLFFLIS